MGRGQQGWLMRSRAEALARGEKWPVPPKWTGSPQMKEGMIVRYRNRCMYQMQRHDFKIGNNRLYDWVSEFGPFMKGEQR